jgi:hypothetical protein
MRRTRELYRNARYQGKERDLFGSKKKKAKSGRMREIVARESETLDWEWQNETKCQDKDGQRFGRLLRVQRSGAREIRHVARKIEAGTPRTAQSLWLGQQGHWCERSQIHHLTVARPLQVKELTYSKSSQWTLL